MTKIIKREIKYNYFLFWLSFHFALAFVNSQPFIARQRVRPQIKRDKKLNILFKVLVRSNH